MRKYLVGLPLLIVPWAVFLVAAKSAGAPNLFTLLLTMAVSAFGLMILIDRRPK